MEPDLKSRFGGRFGFGDCILDLSRRELIVRDQQVPLQPRAFDLLAHFVEHPLQALRREDLIVPLGMWVLESVCQQVAAWSRVPALARLRVAVSMSPRQFRQRDLVAQIAVVLERTGANPRQVCLELTESDMIDSLDDTAARMHELKALGLSFALDDFGTGSSSLSHLQRLPLEQIKIDRSFVLNLEHNASDRALCAGIIRLAQSLELEVVAEGVETPMQRQFLADEHACDLLQGYLLGRPMAAALFIEAALGHGARPPEPTGVAACVTTG